MTLHTMDSMIEWIARRRLKRQRSALERLLRDIYAQAYQDQKAREAEEHQQKGIIDAEAQPH